MSAASGSPTASGSRSAEYPRITPSDSRRRTRAWTADTDNPVSSASVFRVLRPSATRADASCRSIGSERLRGIATP